jgi:hypothetical protein
MIKEAGALHEKSLVVFLGPERIRLFFMLLELLCYSTNKLVSCLAVFREFLRPDVKVLASQRGTDGRLVR